MPAYTDDGRWGARLSSHRGGVISWIAAAAIGVVGAAMCFHFARKGGRGEMKLWVGVFVMGGLTVWTIAETLRLSRLILYLFERGFVLYDGKTLREHAWSDVIAVQAEYVAGARKQGAANEGNLVGLVVQVRSGRFTVPKELQQFRAIVDQFKQRAPAGWTKVEIGTLMNRSS